MDLSTYFAQFDRDALRDTAPLAVGEAATESEARAVIRNYSRQQPDRIIDNQAPAPARLDGDPTGGYPVARAYKTRQAVGSEAQMVPERDLYNLWQVATALQQSSIVELYRW